MDSLLKELKVQGLALSTDAGEALEFAGNFDADTLCAVASVAAGQLRDIGDVLSAGRLERWYLVTEQQAYYVSERSGSRLVAAGDAVKNAEATSKALHRAGR
ncbi:MAG TPA: hypothetical protein VER12_15460 [Polyangiaceae bacterium]|nr:hypothetical protein [Polyangiaceae bacterium]HYQ26974.1 hypothetical protein [Polyangiaceae bacterium]